MRSCTPAARLLPFVRSGSKCARSRHRFRNAATRLQPLPLHATRGDVETAEFMQSLIDSSRFITLVPDSEGDDGWNGETLEEHPSVKVRALFVCGRAALALATCST